MHTCRLRTAEGRSACAVSVCATLGSSDTRYLYIYLSYHMHMSSCKTCTVTHRIEKIQNPSPRWFQTLRCGPSSAQGEPPHTAHLLLCIPRCTAGRSRPPGATRQGAGHKPQRQITPPWGSSTCDVEQQTKAQSPPLPCLIRLVSARERPRRRLVQQLLRIERADLLLVVCSFLWFIHSWLGCRIM